jgi:hypothetical protein
MEPSYTHLQPEERITLASLHQQNWSIRAIAKQQGRSPSTISRELRRNSIPGYYASAPAQAKCEQRRINARPLPKLYSDGAFWHLVCDWLSPYQAFKQFMDAIHEKTPLPFTGYQPAVLHFGFETAPPFPICFYCGRHKNKEHTALVTIIPVSRRASST